MAGPPPYGAGGEVVLVEGITMAAPSYGTKGFKEGDAIEANYQGFGAWFPARIAAVQADGSFDILYDDGNDERVEGSLLRGVSESAQAKLSAPGALEEEQKAERMAVAEEAARIMPGEESTEKDGEESCGSTQGSPKMLPDASTQGCSKLPPLTDSIETTTQSLANNVESHRSTMSQLPPLPQQGFADGAAMQPGERRHRERQHGAMQQGGSRGDSGPFRGDSGHCRGDSNPCREDSNPCREADAGVTEVDEGGTEANVGATEADRSGTEVVRSSAEVAEVDGTEADGTEANRCGSEADAGGKDPDRSGTTVNRSSPEVDGGDREADRAPQQLCAQAVEEDTVAGAGQSKVEIRCEQNPLQEVPHPFSPADMEASEDWWEEELQRKHFHLDPLVTRPAASPINISKELPGVLPDASEETHDQCQTVDAEAASDSSVDDMQRAGTSFASSCSFEPQISCCIPHWQRKYCANASKPIDMDHALAHVLSNGMQGTA